MNHRANQNATLSGAVEACQNKPHAEGLMLTEDGLHNNALPLVPYRSTSDPLHCLEGSSDPDDMSMVYAVIMPPRS